MSFDQPDPEELRKEGKRVLDFISADCLERQVGEPRLPASVDKVWQEFDNLRNGGCYFFYYTEHGFEVNKEFYFIPGCPETTQLCDA